MAVWKWLVGPASGGGEIELTAARGRKAKWQLTGSHEASCALDARHAQATSVAELSTDLHVLRDGVRLYRGRVGACQDTLSETAHVVTVPSVDYRAVLRRRLLYADSTLMYAATDQTSIVTSLLADTQRRAGGNLGIAPPSVATGRTRDRTYKAGESIGVLIDNMADVINGFDWDVEPAGSGLNLNVFFPMRGTDRGVILDYGGAVTSASRSVDPRDYANAGRYSGAEGLIAQVREGTNLATRPEGRWDAQMGFTDITVQSTLNERADAEIAASQTIIPSWTVRTRVGWWQGPGHVWLGDTVRLVVMSGRLKVDTSLRVFEVSVDVGASGEEAVSITLGAPQPDFARRQYQAAQKLTNLERR